MPKLLSRSCHCRQCRERDANAFAAIVDASYTARRRRAIERDASAPLVDALERAYAAPAAKPRPRRITVPAPAPNHADADALEETARRGALYAANCGEARLYGALMRIADALETGRRIPITALVPIGAVETLARDAGALALADALYSLALEIGRRRSDGAE